MESISTTLSIRSAPKVWREPTQAIMHEKDKDKCIISNRPVGGQGGGQVRVPPGNESSKMAGDAKLPCAMKFINLCRLQKEAEAGKNVELHSRRSYSSWVKISG